MTPDSATVPGCLLGLAAGDALGRPAENLTPEEITRRWGRLTELEPGRTARRRVPTTPSTRSSSRCSRGHGSAMTSEDVARAYREQILPNIEGPMKGAGFSELGTVQALRRGIGPPLSGRWHQHGWSDGLAMRAAPYGVFAAGDPGEAARLVAVDGAVSQSGEGIYGGRAVAAAVAVAMTGAAPDEVVGRRAGRGPGRLLDRPQRRRRHPDRRRGRRRPGRAPARRGRRPPLPVDGPRAGGRRAGLRRLPWPPRRRRGVRGDRGEPRAGRRHDRGDRRRPGRRGTGRARYPNAGPPPRPGTRRLPARSRAGRT